MSTIPESSDDTDPRVYLDVVVETLIGLPDADVEELFLTPSQNDINNFSQVGIPGDIRIKAFAKSVIDLLVSINVYDSNFNATCDAVLQIYAWGSHRISKDRGNEATAEGMKIAAEGVLRAVVGDREALDRRDGEACGRDKQGDVDAMVGFRLVETLVGEAIDRMDWSGGAGEGV